MEIFIFLVAPYVPCSNSDGLRKEIKVCVHQSKNVHTICRVSIIV